METLIPNHPELQVAIIDFESTDEGRDALIGQTKVDLEDRFLSIKRPICGLTERYMMWVSYWINHENSLREHP